MKNKSFILPNSTLIDVVAVANGKDPIKKQMTIFEADQIKKKPGWIYYRFQLGFSQF